MTILSTLTGRTDRTGQTGQDPIESGQRRWRVLRRVTQFAASAGVAAALLLGTAGTSSAAVSVGSGQADETVFCNSATHQVAITTMSWGIMSNQIGGSSLFPTYLNYPVYLRIQKFVNGASASLTGWVKVADGTHQVVFNSAAYQTSYWYFMWAFQTPNGGWAYVNEWAGGHGPYGWYSDQRGYRSLTSCRT